MNKTKINLFSLVCCLLIVAVIVCSLSELLPRPVSVTQEIRTISIQEKYRNDLSSFSSYSISEDENTPHFSGATDYVSDECYFFDNVALNDACENYNVEYDCSFDMEKMQYCLTATLLNENGEIVATDTLITDAFVTENGGLDAYIELEGEKYLLSDFCNENGIDSCGLWGTIFAVIAIVVVIYVVVAETAEQIRSRQNYDYNRSLENSGQGVNKGNYITNQAKIGKYGYNSCYYRFGFATFNNVGCEVASAYNAMISFGMSEYLSETIRCFEKWAIEFSIGWGYLGSDPLEIGRYLSRKGIGYTMYTNYSKFKSAVESKRTCKIIMSRWNNPMTKGLHTFYINKTSKSNYDSYNWKYGDISKPNANIDNFNDGSGFIVGYIIWKK